MPAADLAFDADLVRKYDQSGPRYTSYPTADRFHDRFGPADYVNALITRAQQRPSDPLSLYVHLPFCNTICFYCGCNKVITKDHGRSAKYIRYLAREIHIVSSILESQAPVVQLHWGGGTPTFLARDEMSDLMGHLRRAFRLAGDAEVSIEVDPRKVEPSTIAFLGDLGFNRISLGIQDFDADVQKAVNRIQSEEETRAVIDAARAHGFVSVNADLIYGLPRQSVAKFSVTLDKVIDASPDRIALYSYAHLPHLFKPQRRIEVVELPAPSEKLAILALAIEKLGRAGYVYIGMDHFAKPDDELARAQREGRLHRNFQGYTTRPECDLLAFGISAIGKVGRTYSANVKTLDEYYAILDRAQLPVKRGYELTDDDIVRRDAIARLMCDFVLRPADLERRHGIRFAEYFAPEMALLAPLAADGLVVLAPDEIRVTAKGRLLVRPVAMLFDRHLREAAEEKKYSRVI
ncbi:MAG TPA: oxygen-independent coproporphyrinogen III oxidase [Casimicrobiaceae bacterium]|nr:oxygen-independent coproporphyrinogen III oxidase [Casimicrobiaceae bacterium]